MAKYTDDSSWQEYLAEGFSRAVSETGNDDIDGCSIMSYGVAMGEMSCKEGFEYLDENNVPYSFATWTAMVTWDLISESLQDKLIHIIAKTPIAAATIYLKHPSLSNEHDTVLYNAFKDTMPMVVLGLENGTTKRVKNDYS